MTVQDVRKRVEAIRAIAGDDEVAHSREDLLRQEVLEAIRDGAADATELAREALRTSDIEFCRWCAPGSHQT